MQCRLEAHAAPLTKMDEVWAKGVTIKVEESIKLKQFLVGKIRILYTGFKYKVRVKEVSRMTGRHLDCLT